jgi:ribosome-associated protein
LLVDAIADKQGEDIVLLDIRNVSLIADYFIIAAAETNRQINAIAEDVAAKAKAEGFAALQIEGEAESGWVLMDFGAIIVHLFAPGKRAYYALEELWKEAPIVLRMK